MNIALIGYGKMGKTIEALGLKAGHQFPLLIDLDNSSDLNEEKAKGVDVAIEFTAPASAPENLLRCFDLGLPVVCGSTGWDHRKKEIERACKNKKGGLFVASNFSVGVNILFAMNRKLARIMQRFPEYRVSMEEVHHVQKLDAPSGTALSLAEDILEASNDLTGWSLDKGDGDQVLHIEAIRKGDVKGRHSITYASELDTLRLEHDARSREGFASGALMAAAFMAGKQGIYGMNDLLKLDD